MDVAVDSIGHLGVVASSIRYKRDVKPLADRSPGIWQLRPVTFSYKADPSGQRQYGLIAEEVAKVYPELVVRRDKGKIESVQYRELIPLMLNEVQHEHSEMQQQQTAIDQLKAQNKMLRTALEDQNAKLEARPAKLERVRTIASR
jgi:hypothetical protein